MSSADAPQPARPDVPTGRAMRHLATIALTCAALGATTYLVPGLDRFRPWVPGDAPPLARLFENWGDVRVPTFAGAGSSYHAPGRPSEQLEEELGESVARNLGSQGQPAAEPAPATRSAESTPPAVQIDPGAYAGISVKIDDPGHEGMESFYRALLRTAKERKGALTRVAHYGDSSIATDLITHTTRRRLQGRFGDGGHGFLLIARGHMPWGHRDVAHHANDEWSLREIVRSSLRSGLYGYGGVQYRGRPGAWAKFGTDSEAPVGGAVSRYELYYQKGKRGGTVRLSVDGEEVRKVKTRAKRTEDAYERIDVPTGEHELELRVMAGVPALYGVVMEREGPGVVYDSLGLVGARARRMLNYDQDHIAEQLRHRGVDLLVLGFGGNEADDPPGKMKDYDEEFTEVIRHMRAGREDLACLVFSPLDQARRGERGGVRTIPNVPKIVQAQKKAARREGCAFYNTFEAMGGEGAMERWYRSQPRLALSDFRHATPAGYEVIGNMFYKALLEGFADWLRSRS
ncbi:MAG: GDSL-type esterase/lipase family protein, partial [Myxococcota bacterium]